MTYFTLLYLYETDIFLTKHLLIFLQMERAPGKSDSDRTLGSHDDQHRRLKTVENAHKLGDDEGKDDEDDGDKDEKGTEFEHVKDATSHWDAQTVDTATQEQAKVGGKKKTLTVSVDNKQ